MLTESRRPANCIGTVAILSAELGNIAGCLSPNTIAPSTLYTGVFTNIELAGRLMRSGVTLLNNAGRFLSRVDFFALKTQSRPGKCAVRFCRKTAQKPNRFCRRCRDRRYAQDNPVSYAYDKLKWNAKRRGISFTLSKLEWETFCEATGYETCRGRTKLAMSVDRKKDEVGYCLDNIQVLTVSENSAKRSRTDRLPERVRHLLVNQ